MRELKLRAWDKERKKFHYEFENNQDYTLIHKGESTALVCGGYKPNEEWNELDLEQYTGLKDKNGKGSDVYKGDLFEAIYKNCPDGFSIMGKETTVIRINCEVVFQWGRFMIKIMHPELKEYVYSNLSDFLKNEEKVVIGNIHQNPELLK